MRLLVKHFYQGKSVPHISATYLINPIGGNLLIEIIHLQINHPLNFYKGLLYLSAIRISAVAKVKMYHLRPYEKMKNPSQTHLISS